MGPYFQRIIQMCLAPPPTPVFPDRVSYSSGLLCSLELITVLTLPPYIWYYKDGALSSTLQGAVDGPQDFMDTWQALDKLNLIPSLAPFQEDARTCLLG